MKNNKSEPIPVMDYRQYRRARRLVHECCNYIDGNCIALDDGEKCVCVQSISYSLLCRWFRTAVLPQDKELETALFHRLNTHDAFCKTVIRHAAIDAARSIRSRRKREISLEYLIEEKHYPFSTTDKYFTEQSGMNSYPLFVCGQMVLLESPELAAALSALSQMEQEIIFLYYFQRLTHREIGRRYGRAGNTTGRRIQMILRRLRAELEGLSYEPATSL